MGILMEMEVNWRWRQKESENVLKMEYTNKWSSTHIRYGEKKEFNNGVYIWEMKLNWKWIRSNFLYNYGNVKGDKVGYKKGM